MEAGFQLESFTDPARDRSILIDWWYPVTGQDAVPYDYGLGSGRVVEAGIVAPGRFPLVIISHGAMGAARNYSWLTEALARNGYLVAGISHYGESYAHGAETVDPAMVLEWWQRPADVSAAISYITDHSTFADAVASQSISFIGHSSGGATAMSLAGVLFDSGIMAAYCSSDEAHYDRGCDYARSAPPASADDEPQMVSESFADSRIRTFVALDPALGPGFTDFSDVDTAVRMLIVGSVDNDFLPFQHHAGQLAQRFPDAQLQKLTNGEGHFVYLNECTADIKANGVALCRDRPGVARAATHHKLRTLILEFLQQNRP